MSEVAIYRAPRARTVSGQRIISSAAREAIEQIERLLAGAEVGLVGDDALAERERLWAAQLETEGRQCDLPLDNPERHDQP